MSHSIQAHQEQCRGMQNNITCMKPWLFASVTTHRERPACSEALPRSSRRPARFHPLHSLGADLRITQISIQVAAFMLAVNHDDAESI